MISKSKEEYLKTIYVLNKQKGKVRVTDIAEKMNCSKPSVTKQLNILSNNNLIEYESYGDIKLTSDGINLAKKVLADYDILYLLLHDVIGVDESVSREDASKIKNVISSESLEKVSSYLYDALDFNKLNCNFNIRNESCRECITKKGIKRV